MLNNRELTIPEKILSYASTFIGMQEIKGGDHNDNILFMFQEIGHKWVTTDELAWCSCFINYIAKDCGLQRSGKLDARSWLKVGEEINYPLPGDIVIFWRESPESWKGHVGIFVGYNKAGNIFVLGGNQGNEVNITLYNSNRLLGFRRLLNV
jgi:uncharacterized protein (TIGR02594 family)